MSWRGGRSLTCSPRATGTTWRAGSATSAAGGSSAIVTTAAGLPRDRPDGLALATVTGTWWRVDTRPPAAWTWTPFRRPRHRFDPAGGGHRVRYAARTERGAFRERFHDGGRRISPEDAGLSVVRLTGRLRVLALRSERVLDALGLDDEINVGRSARVLAASQQLAQRLLDWFGEDLDGIVYRSRTTPATSANLAFLPWAPLQASDSGRLAERRGLIAHLVVDDGFTVDLQGWSG